jgi:hypothetical protein
MPNQASRAADGDPLRRALQQLQDIVLDGLEHGFFDLSVSGELIKDRKRQVIIKAGKSYQFVIREDELTEIRQQV